MKITIRRMKGSGVFICGGKNEPPTPAAARPAAVFKKSRCVRFEEFMPVVPLDRVFRRTWGLAIQSPLPRDSATLPTAYLKCHYYGSQPNSGGVPLPWRDCLL
jgi:hypothetical protein